MSISILSYTLHERLETLWVQHCINYKGRRCCRSLKKCLNRSKKPPACEAAKEKEAYPCLDLIKATP